uniref:EF-hand domain-containing family member C2 n=1 Tax=Scophthalmus maximus TaxID=52904 RepID=A0A8D3CM09_SCOMX
MNRPVASTTAMALPFLPGNSRNKHLGKEKFHKSHHFDVPNGVSMLAASERPGIGGELLVGQKIRPKYSVYPEGRGGGVPLWVALDKQVLCFEAFFDEAVPGARDEKFRIRKCNIYFYLEDDTIQVVEPQFKNSGLIQGTLIRRHRVPLPPPNGDQFYNIFHFNINQQLVMYSRTFTVTSCDPYTRGFLTKLGVRLNDSTAVPDDPYSILREQIDKRMDPLRPYERQDTLKQFLDLDGQVLRFYCFWDDTGSMFGDPRDLIMLYYLADDTLELREVFAPNSGRDVVAKFLHRGKLPKNAPAPMKQPGQTTDRTVLNVFNSESHGQRYILDRLKIADGHEEFYKDVDLTLGGQLNVFGRKLLIADCDDFTKDYYRSKHGIEDFNPIKYKSPAVPKPARLVPPYNGFGSEEDSLSFCWGLLPKRPQKDFRKFMEKDRCGLDSNVLIFRAALVSNDPVDRERVFFISFYLSDDTISVLERPQRNSGVIGGKFLERGRVRKPDQELYKSDPSEYFVAQDLYVGASLCINSHHFRLLDTDEYTFSYMETHADEFPKADVANILNKLRAVPEEKRSEIRKFLTLSDPGSNGFIPYESFRSLLTGLDCGLSEHEVLVVGRRFSERMTPEADVGLKLAVAQDLLRKKHFIAFTDMVKACVHSDRHRTGRLSTKETRTICKGSRLPLPDDLLEDLLSKFADGDEMDYDAFLAGINWVEHPAPPIMADDGIKGDVNARFDAPGVAVNDIDCSALLADVFSVPSDVVGDSAAST